MRVVWDVLMDGQMMYRTDNTYGGTLYEAQQRAMEVGIAVRAEHPNSYVLVRRITYTEITSTIDLDLDTDLNTEGESGN